MGEKLSSVLSFGAVIALFCVLMTQVVQSYEDRATRGLPPSEEFQRMTRILAQQQREERAAALDVGIGRAEAPVQFAVRESK